MSSDESTATQISAISSQLGIDKKLKPHKSEQWEINLIGNFLLQLYHRLLITPQNNWAINKSELRKEFQNFLTAELKQKLLELNGTDNIGTLLHRCGFIINTVRESNYYRIKGIALYDFRNKKLKEQDNWRLINDIYNNMTNQAKVQKDNLLINLVDKSANLVLEEKIEIDESEPKNRLEYQGTTKQERQSDYYPTNMSCPICQEDFSSMEGYEEHIEKHNDETDFEYLNTTSKDTTPIFTISYRLCKNSHYFCFDIETKSENLVIEKIIIVQSRSFYYVHNTRVPYSMPDSGCEQFFVDSHLFTKYVEQPIVLICHLEDCQETRIIEEHHFMRCEEFPKVQFAINPYRLPDKEKFKAKFQLADYFPPKEIQDALKDDFFYNEKLRGVSNEFRDYVRNENKLQPQTIGPSLNILLQIEDLDTLKQYFNLTQRDVKLRCFRNEYRFRLRPKQRIFIENILTVFDEVILTTRPNISTKPEDLIQLMLQNKNDILDMDDTFVGQIEDVNTSRISFKCYQKIDLKRTYTVICRPSRLNIRYQYRSLEMLPINMHFLKNFLFPAEIVPKPLSTISLTLYNKNISGNPEQLQTVRNIAEGPRNDATYIIFGPPGTGKTTTVVESILQVLKRPETNVLVTASSNSACDEVAIRLCKQLDKLNMSRAIVRIYSRSSESRIDTIDDELLEYSNMYNGHFYPAVDILHEYRIVVCTLSIVAKLATGKFGRRLNGGTLYTHVFIDEVAATMEAEALIGITSILTPKSSLIIAGDHKQLGPILQSKHAQELGLGVSLMDRLMARECYRVNTDTGQYDRTIQTRLRLNFRSHPDIVNLYSGLYYNHGLEPKANIDEVSLVNRWHMAPNKEYPIMFHCVDAHSCSDNQSKSLYNQQELKIVMDYVEDLMYFGINNEPVKETDIGIISPYKKQYKCIQEELNLRKWFKIETGSVETFQGKEKNIIIVSFVRSGTSTLGFLENPRRLNVTISRAKSLLIMIGNPKTLSLNSDFEYIIKECRRHNTIIGSSNSAEARNEHFKRLSASAEKLTAKRNKNNAEKKQKDNSKLRQCQQQNSNAKSTADVVADMKTLNNLMQQLNVTTTPKENTNISHRGRRCGRGRRGGKSKNNQQQSNNQNNKNNSDDSDFSTIDDDKKPSSTGAGLNKNRQDSKNVKSHQQSTTRGQGNSGKISKQYNRGKPDSKDNNKHQQKCKIESLFEALPQVPKITTSIKKNPEAAVRAAIVAQVTQNNVTQMTPMQHQYQQYQSNVQQHFNMNNSMPMNHEPLPLQSGLPLNYNQMGGLPLSYQVQPNYIQQQSQPNYIQQQSQPNYIQQQQQSHSNYMQQQQQQQQRNAYNPSWNFPQYNFQNNMRMPSVNNINNHNIPNMHCNLKQSSSNTDNNKFKNTKESKAGMKSKNLSKTPSTQQHSNGGSFKNFCSLPTVPTQIVNKPTSNSSINNADPKNIRPLADKGQIVNKPTSSSSVNNTVPKNIPPLSDKGQVANKTSSTKNIPSLTVTSQTTNKATSSSSVNNTVPKNISPLTATSSSANWRQLSSVGPTSTSSVNNTVPKNIPPLPDKGQVANKTSSTKNIPSLTVTSQTTNKATSSSSVNNTVPKNIPPLTATSSFVSPAQTSSSAAHSSCYEATEKLPYAASSDLSSTGAIRKYPISQPNTSTIATASVRPVIRQTSTITPTTAGGLSSTSSASVNTSSYSTNNFRTNNFIDSYNSESRLSTTTRPKVSTLYTTVGTRSTPTASATAYTFPTGNFGNRLDAQTGTNSTGTGLKKNNENKCVIS